MSVVSEVVRWLHVHAFEIAFGALLLACAALSVAVVSLRREREQRDRFRHLLPIQRKKGK